MTGPQHLRQGDQHMAEAHAETEAAEPNAERLRTALALAQLHYQAASAHLLLALVHNAGVESSSSGADITDYQGD